MPCLVYPGYLLVQHSQSSHYKNAVQSQALMQASALVQARFQASQEGPDGLIKAAEELQELQSRLKLLEEEAAQGKEALESLRAELKQKDKQLQEQVQAAEADKVHQRSELEDLRGQLTTTADEREGWQDRLETLEEDRASLKSELAALKDAEQGLEGEKASKNALQNELDSLQREVSTLKQQLEASQHAEAELRQSIAKFGGHIGGLEKELESLQADSKAERSRLLKQAQDLESRVSELQEALATATQGAEASEGATQLQSKLQAAETDLQSWQAKYKAVRAKASAALSKQRKESEEKLLAVEQEKDALQGELSSTQHSREQLSSLEKERDQLHERLQASEGLIASLKADSQAVDQLETRCAELSEALQSAHHSAEAHEVQLAEFKSSEKVREDGQARLVQQVEAKTLEIEDLHG